MNVEIMLMYLMKHQHNLYFHAYPYYQALFRVLGALRYAPTLNKCGHAGTGKQKYIVQLPAL